MEEDGSHSSLLHPGLRLQSMPFQYHPEPHNNITEQLKQRGHKGAESGPMSLQIPIRSTSSSSVCKNEYRSSPNRANHSSYDMTMGATLPERCGQTPSISNAGTHEDAHSNPLVPPHSQTSAHTSRVSSASQAGGPVQNIAHQLPPPTWKTRPEVASAKTPTPFGDCGNAKVEPNAKADLSTSKISQQAEKQTRTILKGKRRCNANEMQGTQSTKDSTGKIEQKFTAPADKPVNHVKPTQRVETSKTQGSVANNGSNQQCNDPTSDGGKSGPSKTKSVDDIAHKLQNTTIKEHPNDGKDDNNATCKDEKNEKDLERHRQLAAAAKQAEERLNEIRAENRRLKEAKQCRVCRDRDANRMFLPCAHLCSCNLCSPALRNCPQCKGSIKGIISVYFS